MSDPRYPIGPFTAPATLTREERADLIQDIAQLPRRLRETLAAVQPSQLARPYREGGWTARQVVHHIADSHLNAYVRFRLALTESTPTIRPYAEGLWAELPDAKDGDVALSLSLVEALHARWVSLLEAMTEDQWNRDFFHPEPNTTMALSTTLAMYSWHGRHHLAHIEIITREK